MQHAKKDYNENLHEIKKALTVKNPYAELIAQGEKTIEVRSRKTTHRGEIVICSSANPVIEDMQNGVTLCTVNLYKVKHLKHLTDEERGLTMIPRKQLDYLIKKNHYAWMLKDVRRLVEYPVKGQLGIWSLVMDKLEFVHYGGKSIRDIDVHITPKKFNKKAVIVGLTYIAIAVTIIVTTLVYAIKFLFN